MAGTATLNPDVLIDDLVDVIDEVRGDVAEVVGNRPFRVFVVKRTWPTDELVGGNEYYQDVVVEITPTPMVQQWDGYKWVMLTGGHHEDGQIRIVEVSLSYTFAELGGNPATQPKNAQIFYWLIDAHGQGGEPRCLHLIKPPYPDREKTIGWVLDVGDYNIPDGTEPVIPT